MSLGSHMLPRTRALRLVIWFGFSHRLNLQNTTTVAPYFLDGAEKTMSILAE